MSVSESVFGDNMNLKMAPLRLSRSILRLLVSSYAPKLLMCSSMSPVECQSLE